MTKSKYIIDLSTLNCLDFSSHIKCFISGCKLDKIEIKDRFYTMSVSFLSKNKEAIEIYRFISAIDDFTDMLANFIVRAMRTEFSYYLQIEVYNHYFDIGDMKNG